MFTSQCISESRIASHHPSAACAKLKQRTRAAAFSIGRKPQLHTLHQNGNLRHRHQTTGRSGPVTQGNETASDVHFTMHSKIANCVTPAASPYPSPSTTVTLGKRTCSARSHRTQRPPRRGTTNTLPPRSVARVDGGREVP